MGLFNDITPFTLFPLPTCPESASSADVPDKDIYMPPSPNPLLSRVLRCMFTLSKSCQNSLSTVFFIIPFILNFFKKYSFSSLTYLEIKGMATVKSRDLPLRNPITLTSSPVSGRTVLILSEFKNLSISYTAFSADVNGAYPTAADVSLAPLSFPFLLNISVSSSEPGARTTLYLTFFSAGPECCPVADDKLHWLNNPAAAKPFLHLSGNKEAFVDIMMQYIAKSFEVFLAQGNRNAVHHSITD